MSRVYDPTKVWIGNVRPGLTSTAFRTALAGVLDDFEQCYHFGRGCAADGSAFVGFATEHAAARAVRALVSSANGRQVGMPIREPAAVSRGGGGGLAK